MLAYLRISGPPPPFVTFTFRRIAYVPNLRPSPRSFGHPTVQSAAGVDRAASLYALLATSFCRERRITRPLCARHSTSVAMIRTESIAGVVWDFRIRRPCDRRDEGPTGRPSSLQWAGLVRRRRRRPRRLVVSARTPVGAHAAADNRPRLNELNRSVADSTPVRNRIRPDRPRINDDRVYGGDSVPPGCQRISVCRAI